MKRFLSVIMVIAMVVCSFPPREAQAATVTYCEVISDGTTIHAKNRGSSRVVATCQAGAVLEVKGSCRNIFFNKWYKLDYNGQTCYIYSKDVKPHNHSYMDLSFNGVTYMICDCGSITQWADSYEDRLAGENVSKAVTMALPITLAAADGPLPVGDLLAAGILILAGCMSMDVSLPTTEELAVLMSEAEFEDYIKSREYACAIDSFRRVKRENGQLRYIDDNCLDRVEAYIWVRFLNGDVYTPYEDNAMLLAAMHGAATMERDKDKKSYFYHYHLGVRDETKQHLGGHIFFGTNDYFEVPY